MLNVRDTEERGGWEGEGGDSRLLFQEYIENCDYFFRSMHPTSSVAKEIYTFFFYSGRDRMQGVISLFSPSSAFSFLNYEMRAIRSTDNDRFQ